jgi:outer membrane lipoprotein-sorting protein
MPAAPPEEAPADAAWSGSAASPETALGAAPRIERLDELLALFRKSTGWSARFVEEKHIALLKAPLTSEGMLYYLPTDRLARHVEKPKPSRLLLEGDRVTVADAGGSRTLDLSRSPALAALVQSFVQVLRGDRQALDAHYDVAFRAPAADGKGETDGRWSVVLKPRSEKLAKMVQSIEVSGVGERLEGLVVVEASGDRSVTRFSDVRTNRRFTEEERKRLFCAPAP